MSTFVTARSTRGKNLLTKCATGINNAKLLPADADRVSGNKSFQKSFIALLRSCSANYDRAANILGKGFIPPEEIATARKLKYAEGLLARYSQTLPDEDIMKWCADNDTMLVAGPPKGYSLLDVRTLQPAYWYTQTGGWYADPSQEFASREKVPLDWLALRQNEKPDSTNKLLDEQHKLLSDDEYVPKAGQVGWGITTYKAVRGVFLVPHMYLRTSSVSADGHPVLLGDSSDGGLDVDNGCGRNPSIGLAVARKLRDSNS